MRRGPAGSPVWAVAALVAAGALLWLVFAPWSAGMEAALGRKRVFLNALFNGITLGALYFLVAAGFTLIFGLMRNVNLAHGSLYLMGGYVGFEAARATGSWLLAFVAAFAVAALAGLLLQVLVFRRMEGQDLRQTLVTIGLSVVLADVMLWIWGGEPHQLEIPGWLAGPVDLPVIASVREDGTTTPLRYPIIRLVILGAAAAVGIALWLALARTRIGMLIRAGVDDREMVAAAGVPIQRVFAAVFAFGAGLAGVAGVVGGTFQSLSPGEDVRFLLTSLVVVIVGGMGSIPGAALGALLIGLADQFGSVYAPTYSVVLTFLIMAAVLAFRPQGLLGTAA